MTKIFIIDDQFNRHLEHASLVADLQNKGFSGDVCPDEAAAKSKAQQCIDPEAIWALTTTADVDSVFLVDLNLGVDETAAKDRFSKLVADAHKPIKDNVSHLLPVCEQYADYYSAVFGCAVLKARGIPTIIISSAAVQVGRALKAAWGTPLCVGTGEFEWPTWKDGILNLMRHENPLLRGMLVRYSQPIRTDANAWEHNRCDESAVTTALEMLSISMFDESRSPNSKFKEIKALFMRPNGAWALRSPENVVSSKTLIAALSALGIEACVDASVFEFPVSPGIAFLISLKELLLETQDKGAPKSIRFFTLPADAASKDCTRLFGIRIEFFPSPDHPDGLNAALRLLEKLRSAGSDSPGPAGGLAEGIWNLGHCRSNGIRTFGDEWAKMFANGSPYWNAWPSFDVNSVTFHWESQ